MSNEDKEKDKEILKDVVSTLDEKGEIFKLASTILKMENEIKEEGEK